MRKNNKKNILILLLLSAIFVCIIIVQIKMKPKMISTPDENKEYAKLPKLNEQTISKLSEKDLIWYKIMNSIDFFSTAQGEFESINKTINSDGKIDYAADIKNQKNIVTSVNKLYGENSTVIINNNKKIEFDDTQKTYREFEYKMPQKDNTLKWLYPKDRYDSNGNYRSRPDGDFLLLGDSNILFDQEIVCSTLGKIGSSTWGLDGEEKYLGRECVRINGTLTHKGEFGQCVFEGLIDKNTGIIMKFYQLDNNNQVILETVTNKIKIDEPIDPKVFIKDTVAYTKK